MRQALRTIRRSLSNMMNRIVAPTLLAPKTGRVRYLHLRILGYGTIIVSVRTFHTNENNRSKKYRQLVIPLDTLDGVKEVAIRRLHRQKSLRSQKLRIPTGPQRFRYSYPMIAIGAIGIVYFGFSILRTINYTPAYNQNLVLAIQPPAITSEPVFFPKSTPKKIEIPSIGVSRDVRPVGLLSDGTLETPEVSSGNIGWYSYSPTPGQMGPSVLVAHVDTYEGPSIFWKLSTLLAGDEIVVYREDGSRLVFGVTKVEQHDQNSFPTQSVYGNTDDAGIRFITCGGKFNYLTGRYSANTIVYGTMKTGNLAYTENTTRP